MAESSNISVDPATILFEGTKVGESSRSETVTLKSLDTATAISVGALSLQGNGNDFTLSADNCSNTTLDTSTPDCTLTLQFTPQTGGVRAGWVDIPYTISGTTDHLALFMTNKEDTSHEIRRRLQPAMDDVNITQNMEANATYTMTWSVLGYHDDYKVKVAMFDCNGTAAGECGNTYGDTTMFYESNFLTADSQTSSSWEYKGEEAKTFNFSHTFTVPDKNWDANGTTAVIRFYIISTQDIEADKPSISLIIPGNLDADYYYDTSGRKLKRIFCPSGGCTP
jgi:hypothetical protein